MGRPQGRNESMGGISDYRFVDAFTGRRRGPRLGQGRGLLRRDTFSGSMSEHGRLRFAAGAFPGPRKTCFRLLAKLHRAGLVTRRVPMKGF